MLEIHTVPQSCTTALDLEIDNPVNVLRVGVQRDLKTPQNDGSAGDGS